MIRFIAAQQVENDRTILINPEAVISIDEDSETRITVGLTSGFYYSLKCSSSEFLEGCESLLKRNDELVTVLKI